MLVAASKGFRIQGRRSVVPYICGCIQILPDMIPLGTVAYEIDQRSVVIQHQRIVRCRAKVWPWRATFTIRYDSETFTPQFMKETFLEIVTNGGRAVGLLDFRPEKRGRFGRFKVDAWNV